MDATQLSLLLTARIQSNSKMTLPLGDDATGTDSAFSELLKKQDAAQDELRRQSELDRQNWRSQAPSYTPSQVSSASTSAAAATDSTRSDSAGSNSAVNSVRDKSPRKTDSQASSAAANTGTQHSATRSSAVEQNRNATASSGKADKSRDTSADNDRQVVDGQAATANGDASGTKHSQQPDQSSDGNDPSGDGQNQGQSGQDNGQQQQSADAGDSGTALAENVDGTILAGLMMTQPVVPNVTVSGQSTTGGLTVAGTNLGSGTTGTGDIQAASTAQGNTALAAAAQANSTLVPALPGSGTVTPASPGAGADAAATTGLPQAAPNATNRAAQDLASSFATIVAKNTATPAATQDNARISITKTDTGVQMPKPLVKLDSDHTALAATAPTVASAETDSAATTHDAADFSTGLELGDGGDDLRTFSSYSPLLASGSGLAVAGKQADALTALRQQLANASIQDQVAIHMQRAVKDSVDKISIQLSPTELGRVHVKMSVDEDKNVTATITVERPATLDLLQRDTKTLERALQEAGLKTDSGSLSFSLQRGNQGDSSDRPSWGQGNGRRIGSSGQENSATAGEVSSATAGNEIDTANGLVNVAV